MLPFVRTGLAAVTAICLASSGAGAAVITENLALPETGAVSLAMGQSVTTPSGGPWNQITFNYFRTFGYGDPLDPYATGGLFLLSQEYLGMLDELSTSTPGYIAHSTGTQAEDSGSEWTFAADMPLQPGTQYWFYMDQDPVTPLGFNEAYPGGDMYYADFFGYNNGSISDARFQLEGTSAAVPEPSTLAIWCLLAVCGIGIGWRRRRKA